MNRLGNLIENICREKSSVMVYGFSHCYYDEIYRLFEEKGVKVYDWNFGANGIYRIQKTRAFLFQKKIKYILNGFESDTKRACKTGLVNIIFENYRRFQEGEKKITPIVFCIDKESNPYKIDILSKDPSKNTLITYSELRRAYKLCNDPQIDPEIRNIAQKTFRFVKIKKPPSDLSELEEIAAPWDSPLFEDQFKLRQFSSKHSFSTPKGDWRRQINALAVSVRERTSIASLFASLKMFMARWFCWKKATF